MKVLTIAAYVLGIVYTAAAALSLGDDLVGFSGEGFRLAIAWAVSWFQAGGNMIPRIGWDQSVMAWAVDRMER